MTDRKKCPCCGSPLHNDAQFCIYCMHSLQTKTDVTPPLPPRRPFLLWIVLLFFLLLVVALIFLGRTVISFVSSQNQNQKTSQSLYADDIEASPDITTQPTQIEEYDREDTPETEPSPTENVNQEQDSQIEAEPPESLPAETFPTPCAHQYQEATCAVPMTCILCGKQRGEADENAHQWIAETATVYHEEKGHYAELTDYVQKTKYLCFFCGYNQEGFDSMDAVREHITVHSGHSTYDLIVSYPDMLTETREVWEAVTMQEWIVDQEAYEETIIEGYSCSVCGKKKEA